MSEYPKLKPEDLNVIRPGHPIWDEVWQRAQPGPNQVSHVEQLYHAKLQVARLEAQNKALCEALEEVIEIFKDVRIEGQIDSFSLQPARAALAQAKEQG